MMSDGRDSGGSGAVDWAAEYARTRDRVLAILTPLEGSRWGQVVPACPEWTVHDLVAHLSGLAWALTSDRTPGPDVQAWIDGLVEARRGARPADLLAEWQATATAIDEYLRARGDGGGQLVLDAVAHEHDLCHALGVRGERESSTVRAALSAMSVLLARDLAAKGLGAIALSTAEREWTVGEGAPRASLSATPFELLRIFGSRRSERQIRALPWRGDLDDIFPALVHFPLPVTDIEE